VVAAQYWWQYDTNIHFFAGSKQMGEGVNVMFMDITILK
jgi:hypothetical protein